MITIPKRLKGLLVLLIASIHFNGITQEGANCKAFSDFQQDDWILINPKRSF